MQNLKECSYKEVTRIQILGDPFQSYVSQLQRPAADKKSFTVHVSMSFRILSGKANDSRVGSD